MSGTEIPAEIAAHYESYDEDARLSEGSGRLEAARTRLLIQRYLPPPPALVLDVGGGPGAYAHWLARAGYEVHLRDPMAGHVAQALEAGGGNLLASTEVGDARSLDFEDETADGVLLLGPLYHLTEPDDRARALEESMRVLRPGGPLFAAGISRFASALDGLWRNFIADPAFRHIMHGDLTDGQHRNDTGNPSYFTTAYFHEPEELRSELEAAGLTGCRVLAVEGIGWIMPDFDDRWQDDASRRLILELLDRTEAEPSIMGVSPHLLAVGWKPG